MKKQLIASFALSILMVSTAALTMVLTPTNKLADHRGMTDLDTLIPSTFADWRIDRTIIPLQVDPETQAKIDKLYNQTLARTYVNADGLLVMLSIAYGGDQSDQLALHKPEACYLAQGFEIKKNVASELSTQFGDLPSRRLLAVRGTRIEPITYWVTVGDKAVLSGINQKFQQIRYGLSGNVPDGMLVRVSTLGIDEDQAYKLQEAFVRDMLAEIGIKERIRLIGYQQD